ncbi:hypothetical protein DAPPUDRAFT_245808 [Daphnia pulex]|uniref:Uncharacterized protein n=1 Tax=Daphnia pulex TaxID=6669 RepID=E9GP39_DAPPU|nr:hypothetical protein DAPPUDRAFT_245808 [Daphnia pulex]|eukprot:EFX78575.1 hypothetical protein DAPPUDRAFT_245808 [Daphnia pulex]
MNRYGTSSYKLAIHLDPITDLLNPSNNRNESSNFELAIPDPNLVLPRIVLQMTVHLQMAEGDGVQSFLAIFSENIDEGRKTYHNFGPQAAMVFDSPEGIAFVKKWLEVINLYQKERRAAYQNMKEGSSLGEQGRGSVTAGDENESESIEHEDGRVEENPVPPIIASTPSISPESQP